MSRRRRPASLSGLGLELALFSPARELSLQRAAVHAEGTIALGGGLLVDTRALNACRSVAGDLAYCAGNRPGEQEREVGSTRANLLANFAWNIDARWSLNFGLQLPVTPRRDFDVGASAGVQVVF